MWLVKFKVGGKQWPENPEISNRYCSVIVPSLFNRAWTVGWPSVSKVHFIHARESISAWGYSWLVQAGIVHRIETTVNANWRTLSLLQSCLKCLSATDSSIRGQILIEAFVLGGFETEWQSLRRMPPKGICHFTSTVSACEWSPECETWYNMLQHDTIRYNMQVDASSNWARANTIQIRFKYDSKKNQLRFKYDSNNSRQNNLPSLGHNGKAKIGDGNGQWGISTNMWCFFSRENTKNTSSARCSIEILMAPPAS